MINSKKLGSRTGLWTIGWLSAISIGGSHALAGGNLTVTQVSPEANSMNASTTTTISVTFDRAVDPASFTQLGSFWAFGRWSGTVMGTFQFSNGNQTVTLVPNEPLSAGESVMVILSRDLQAQDATFLRNSGYSFQFMVRSAPSSLDFNQIQLLNTTNDGSSPQPYGGIGTDLNNDGFLDLTMVNEVTFDLRVFMNLADGTGNFEPDFLEPTFPVGERASPSEPSDFDRDGNADIALCNIDTGDVSILLGNGDGTFAPQQLVNVSGGPRGIAVLDADGDGDIDIINTNSNGTGSMSRLLNNGSGVFGPATFFEGGGDSEWALGAADMNEDGLLDLVVGARDSQTNIVHTSDGDGTFTISDTQSSGGRTWMLVLGDVNGDGHVDVANANSNDNSGSIVMGDGTGNLIAPAMYGTDPFPLATDLGDIDGDGDLDWITSSFSGDWFLFLNDGVGNFTFDREFNAPVASSCSIMMDIDNDQDIDLALIDEIADVVLIMSNGGPAQAVPAMQTWGIAVCLLILMSVATIIFRPTIILRPRRL